MKITLIVGLLFFVGLVVGLRDNAEYSWQKGGKTAPKAANTGVAHFLTAAAQQTGAVCIDGTPSAYYIRKGTGSGANKWYLHHQGGGWCESVSDCYSRSQTDLGSSKNYPQTLDLGGGYFSNDPKENPQMYNWNAVLMRYCDGGSFSGDNNTVTNYQGHSLYFRGHRILQAMATDLLINQGLSKATDVIVSGCSAGGLATYLHTDWWRERLPKTAHVIAVPDSGFFLDYESAMHYHSGMIWVFNFMNCSSGVNQRCIESYQKRGETWKCFFAEHTSPFIITPTFPLQSTYDSWQIIYDLDSKDTTLINQYGQNLTTLVKQNLLDRHHNGVFLDSCQHHCGAWGSIVIDGLNQAKAIQNFYEGTGRNDHIQGKPYPCTACCSP